MPNSDSSRNATASCRRGTTGSAPVKVGVVIPLANEQETVDELLDRVLLEIHPWDRVFCVVDEFSRDDTRARVEARAISDPRIRLLWAPENRCVVDAYFRGYAEAIGESCEWILEMDGGLSHKPEQIPRFLRAMSEGFDFAAGSRFIRGGSHTGSWQRYVVSKGGTWLANFLLGTKMHDMTSGFECFTRETLSYVLERGVESRGPFFQTEIRYALRNCAWVEVPIDYVCTSSTVARASIIESFRILWRLFRQGRNLKQEDVRH